MPPLYAVLAVVAFSVLGYALGRRSRQRKPGNAVASLPRELEIFNQLLNASQDGFVLYKISADGNSWSIVMCNARMATMHGYTLGEMRALTVADLDPSAKNPGALRSALARLRQHGSHSGEAIHFKKDGTPFPIEYRGTHMVLDGEEHVLGVDRDITQRKSALEKLQSSEELFRRIIDTSPDSVLLVEINIGAAWKIVRCNQRTAEMHGYDSVAEIIGQSITLLALPERTDPQARPFLERIQLERTFSGETMHRRRDGTTFPIEYRASLLVINGKEHYIAIDRDITARKRAESELLQSRKLRAVGEMVGGIAHEFNNLLTPMLVQASMISESRAADGELIEQLRPIKNAATEAKELTQRILTFGRHTPHVRERVDLCVITQDNFAFIRHTLDRRIQFSVSSTAAPHWVEQNRSDLNQIIINLTLNARDTLMEKLTQPVAEGWTAYIGITIDQVERQRAGFAPLQWHRLTVSDNGCGIPPQVRERIFEPFFTTKGVGLGTGLGLATVWHVVTEMGGWIEVESTEGSGTEMSVYLPAAAEVAAPFAPPVPVAITAPPAAQSPLPRVLLVEDNEQIAPVLVRVLQRKGYTVAVLTDGLAAWHCLNEETVPYDLLITDINLPGKTGIELLQLLRKKNLAMRVVVMGGYLTQDMTDQLNVLKVDAVIPKPFEISDLIAALAVNEKCGSS